MPGSITAASDVNIGPVHDEVHGHDHDHHRRDAKIKTAKGQ